MYKLIYPGERCWHETAVHINDKYFLLKKDGWYEVDKPVYDKFLEYIKAGKIDKGSIWNKAHANDPPQLREWKVKSRSRDIIHTVYIDDNGILRCTCEGYKWHQWCNHCKDIRKEYNLTNLMLKEKLTP